MVALPRHWLATAMLLGSGCAGGGETDVETDVEDRPPIEVPGYRFDYPARIVRDGAETPLVAKATDGGVRSSMILASRIEGGCIGGIFEPYMEIITEEPGTYDVGEIQYFRAFLDGEYFNIPPDRGWISWERTDEGIAGGIAVELTDPAGGDIVEVSGAFTGLWCER